MSSASASSRIFASYSSSPSSAFSAEPDHERDVVARELVLGEQVADLDLDELEQLGVVDHVDLVEEHDDVGDADLTGEQDVLARLGHRAVGRRHDQDRAVHLGGAGDHVLDVVGVPRTVDVRVVPVGGLVLDVGGRDRDAARLLLRSVVDRFERPHLGAAVPLVEHLGDGRGQRRLAMVDVTDGADVDMGLVALELGFRHFGVAPSVSVVVFVCGRTYAGYKVPSVGAARAASGRLPLDSPITCSAMFAGTSS